MSNLKLINMQDIEVEAISWLWYPFIPYGKLTIIQGDPGEGKTTLVLQIIARLTKGESIINEDENLPINVIYQTAEDGLADTIKPRLLAANADCSKVLVIDDKEESLSRVMLRTQHKDSLSSPSVVSVVSLGKSIHHFLSSSSLRIISSLDSSSSLNQNACSPS